MYNNLEDMKALFGLKEENDIYIFFKAYQFFFLKKKAMPSIVVTYLGINFLQVFSIPKCCRVRWIVLRDWSRCT